MGERLAVVVVCDGCGTQSRHPQGWTAAGDRDWCPRCVADLDWWDRAACQGVDQRVFFPSAGLGYEVAAKICGRCRVWDRCLAYAMSAEEGLSEYTRHGMWGGLTPTERAVLAGRTDG